MKDLNELLSKYFKIEVSDYNQPEKIINFQANNNLAIDGICGLKTYYKLRQKTVFKKLGKTKFKSNKIKTGFNNNYLVSSDPLTKAYGYIEKVLNTYGTGLSSSGSIRSLDASITTGRVNTSFHYLLRAIDLYVESFMRNPKTDDYVCVYNGDRTYTVYARMNHFDIRNHEQITLHNVATYENRTGVNSSVSGYFINLTELFLEHGFQNIRCRKSFIEDPKSSMYGGEIHHFQYCDDLEDGTFFGELLYNVYGEDCYSSEVYKQNKYKKLNKSRKTFL